MAIVALVGSLAAALESVRECGESHVWIDLEHGLVVGNFPKPIMRFDFATEKFAPLEIENAPQKRRISLVGNAKRFVKKYELEIFDTIYETASAKQTLVHGLNEIEKISSGTHEKISRIKKQSKRHVAKTQEDLYDVKHQRIHSERLDSGYYVGTNNKSHEAFGVLKKAAELAGISDFAIREK